MARIAFHVVADLLIRFESTESLKTILCNVLKDIG